MLGSFIVGGALGFVSIAAGHYFGPVVGGVVAIAAIVGIVRS